MKQKYFSGLFIFTLLLVAIVACSDDDDAYVEIIEETVPTVDLALVPFIKLSDYHFFKGEIKEQQPSKGVLPYEPASSLFTDYALKNRFVWMPDGTKATYNGDAKVLELPVGAVLIKTFYYNNVQPSNASKIIETRIMIKVAEEATVGGEYNSGWKFYNYVWNEEQTDAYLDMNGSDISISWLENGMTKSTVYRIPSETECLVCHKSNGAPIPIGIKPQNLNVNFEFNDGTRNQLAKWIAVGYLENNLPASIVSTVNYKDAAQPLDLRMRSYVDINCAHCHQEGSHCSYRPIRLAFNESGSAVNMGICVTADQEVEGLSTIISPGNIQRSLMHFRMNTTEPNYKMPLVGRNMIHTEGVQLMEQWINSLQSCD
jgi:uncharacterized repeat protein (TIGR03806 family)